MKTQVNKIINIQRDAWNRGHDNYGTELDVYADMHYFLTYFKHLNKAQKALLVELEKIDNLQYAKKLCSKAHKAVRHYIVTLK